MLTDKEKQQLRQELQNLQQRDNLIQRETKNQLDKAYAQLAFRYSYLGLEFIALILLFLYLGKYLDSLWGTQPWLLLAGAVVGFIGAMFRLVHLATKLNKED